MHRTTRRTAVALSAALALAAPLVAVPALAANDAGEQTTALAAPVPDPGAGPAPDAPAGAADSVAEKLAEAARTARDNLARSGTLAQRTDAEARADLDAALDQLVAEGAVSVTARIEKGADTWAGAAGSRERGGATPARPDDRFRVAGNTMPMVAVLVLQEVEKGTWSLDTPVSDVLPGIMPADVTIEQLLSHRSGAPTGDDWILDQRTADPGSAEQLVAAVRVETSFDDYVAALENARWVGEPGTGFSSSNAGYVVLGRMLEEVTGRSVGELLETRVFGPADMGQSSAPEDPGVPGPFLHEAIFAGPEAGDWVDVTGYDPSFLGSAGAVSSTTEDLADLGEALMTHRLLAPETTADMMDPRTEEDARYGLGIYRVEDPCVPGGWLYGHDGTGIGNVSTHLTSPDGRRQITAVVTGRNLSDASGGPIFDESELFVELLEASC